MFCYLCWCYCYCNCCSLNITGWIWRSGEMVWSQLDQCSTFFTLDTAQPTYKWDQHQCLCYCFVLLATQHTHSSEINVPFNVIVIVFLLCWSLWCGTVKSVIDLNLAEPNVLAAAGLPVLGGVAWGEGGHKSSPWEAAISREVFTLQRWYQASPSKADKWQPCTTGVILPAWLGTTPSCSTTGTAQVLGTWGLENVELSRRFQSWHSYQCFINSISKLGPHSGAPTQGWRTRDWNPRWHLLDCYGD